MTSACAAVELFTVGVLFSPKPVVGLDMLVRFDIGSFGSLEAILESSGVVD